MAKVSIKTADALSPTTADNGYSIRGQASAYFEGDEHPLHLHRLDLAAGDRLSVTAETVDKLGYVWKGSIEAGGHRLAAGSSFIVERGRQLEVSAGEDSVILAFAAAAPSSSPLAGGNVHLLPAEGAPRSEDLGGTPGVKGVLHADSDCPTCEVWLHENHFPGREAAQDHDEAGVHSHTEDEIIFVLDGQIRLGNKLYGPGTALAIAAKTLYSFTPGPEGLAFVNFRAAKPGDIRFANGRSMSETQYWRDRLPRPEYLSPAASMP